MKFSVQGLRKKEVNMYRFDESKNNMNENYRFHNKAIIIQYNSYKKEIKYFYQIKGKISRINENISAELNPYRWNQVENIIDILIEKYSKYNNGKLVIYFQGCTDDFNKLKDVCDLRGCTAFYDETKTLISAPLLFPNLIDKLKNIKNEIHIQEIEKYLDYIIDNAYRNDDISNSCKFMVDALHYCTDELTKYYTHDGNDQEKQKVTFDKGSWYLLKSKEYKWQDLKEISDTKFYDTQKLKIYITDRVIADLKDNTFNYFAKRFAGGFNNIGMASNTIKLNLILPGNINTDKLQKLYNTEFDSKLYSSVKKYINDNLILNLRNSLTVKKIEQAKEMTKLIHDVKIQYFDDFAEVFMSCINKELGGYNDSTNNKLMYETKRREYLDLFNEFKRKIDFM